MDYSTTVDALVEYRFAKSAPLSPDGKAVAGKDTIQPRLTKPGFPWLDGLAVRVGVRNIFDDAPPFANNVAGYPVPLEDPRQRFFFLDVEKRF